MPNKEEAVGVINRHRATNMALAERSYAVPCKMPMYPIVVYEGYYIWWCTPHHQPLSHCDLARAGGKG